MKTGLIEPADLREICGTPIKKRQAEQLRKNRIRFFEDVDGRPRITWESFNAQLTGVTVSEESSNDDGFDLESIK